MRADVAVPELSNADPVMVIAAADSISVAEPFVANGRVVDVDDERVTIAVDVLAATTLAGAAQTGRLTVAAAGSGAVSARSSTTR